MKPDPSARQGRLYRLNDQYPHKDWRGRLVTLESTDQRGIYGLVTCGGVSVYIAPRWSQIEPYPIRRENPEHMIDDLPGGQQ